MAEDVARSAVPVRPEARPTPSRAERAHASAYFFRFGVAYAVLGLLAAAGVAALVVVLTRPDAVVQPRWSSFVPTGSPIAQVRQIATQVSAEYRAPTGRKLVTVLPGPLQATRFLQTDSGPVSVEVPITSVAVQPDVSTGKHEEGAFTSFSAGSTIAYQMCGLGNPQQNCGVASATGTNPGPLLRREALELALYTLKYVSGVDAVLTYLPPPASAQASPTAVLVARKDIKGSLDRPLTRTLTPKSVYLGQALPDGARVTDLTKSRLYTYDYQTLPGDGTAILVLTAALSAQ